MPTRSLIAIVTPAFGSEESVEVLKREAAGHDGDPAAEVRLVAPAVEINPLHHTLGDIDEPRVEAGDRLGKAVAAARAAGLAVSAEVGDPDPVQAAQDALLKKPADEILIFSHADNRPWYEGELWKHAEDSLEPPLKLILVDGGPEGDEHVVKTDTSTAGYANNDARQEIGSAYLPGLSRGDLGGMILGIVGTIIAIILASIATAGGTATGWRAFAIGLTIFIVLINMAHVVGLLLMESVRYRGGFAKFFSKLSLIGTPLVVLVNLAIVIFA
jgi:phage-related minor tail protein